MGICIYDWPPNPDMKMIIFSVFAQVTNDDVLRLQRLLEDKNEKIKDTRQYSTSIYNFYVVKLNVNKHYHIHYINEHHQQTENTHRVNLFFLPTTTGRNSCIPTFPYQQQLCTISRQNVVQFVGLQPPSRHGKFYEAETAR